MQCLKDFSPICRDLSPVKRFAILNLGVTRHFIKLFIHILKFTESPVKKRTCVAMGHSDSATGNYASNYQ